jgi:hypothetical protein
MTYEEKLKAALEALGPRHVLARGSTFDPNHEPVLEVWLRERREERRKPKLRIIDERRKVAKTR